MLRKASFGRIARSRYIPNFVTETMPEPCEREEEGDPDRREPP
jgi:hypothetical protein